MALNISQKDSNFGIPGPPRRMMVVEDQPLIGLSLKESLTRAGAEVIWVQTDKAAYAALNGRARPFDTLILDIDLGEGTTGFDIARYARNKQPEIAIVISSGSPAEWLQSCGVEGAIFVAKPCSDAALLSACALIPAPEALDSRSQSAAS